ncbi:DUF1294 domain-containing protein [[Clostridium] aminophilum]|uniref:DUF1294 domain-containing protein n=1 Tax=[Clostridium] aminophilum TaxID=1526 RepID=UPI00331E2B5E
MEEFMTNVAMVYAAAVNIIAFLMFGMDKMRAKRNEWRIPESSLLTVALIGGSVGAWAGMRFFHHKTRKPRFTVSIPVMMLAQAALLVWMRSQL